MSQLPYFDLEDLPDLPYEIYHRISNFLKPKDWYNLSFSNRQMNAMMKMYGNYCYPMKKNEKKAFSDLLSLKEEKRISFLSFPTKHPSIVLLNYIYAHLREKQNNRVIILAHSYQMEIWRKFLSFSEVCIFEKINNRDARKKRPFAPLVNKRVVVVPLLSDFFYKLIHEWRPSLIIANGRYDDVDIKIPETIQFIAHKHEQDDDSFDVKIVQKCRIMEPCYPCYHVIDELSYSIKYMFTLYDSITLLGVSWFDSISSGTYEIIRDDDEKTFPSGTKILRIYSNKYLQQMTPSISGVILVKILSNKRYYDEDFTCPFIYHPTLLSTDIDSVWISGSLDNECTITDLYNEMYYLFSSE